MSRRATTLLGRFFQRFSSEKRRPEPTRRARLEVTLLETREVPAANVFTGAAPNDLWSTAANWSQNRPPIATDDVFLGANPHQSSTMDGDFTVQSLQVIPADSELELQGTLSVTCGMNWQDQHIRGGTILLKTGSSSVWGSGMLLSSGLGAGELEVEAGANLTIDVNLQSGLRMIESEIRNRGVINFDASDAPNLKIYNFSMTDAQIWNMPGASLNFDGINDGVLNLNGAGASGVFNSFGAITVDDGITVNVNALLSERGADRRIG